MFVRSVSVALFLATALFSLDVEAQLFRFGRSRDAGRSNYAQPQTATTYDASAYRYTRPQQTATYIPSQRQPTCSCANSGTQQVANPAMTAVQQSRIVVATYRDPYTGRTMQRQYLVQGAAQQTQAQQTQAQRTVQIPPPMVATQTNPQSQLISPPASAVDSDASTIDLASPISVAPDVEGVRQTSLESVVVPQTPDSNGQFSVLEGNSGTVESQPGATSVLNSSLPVLELQESTSSDSSTLEIETDSGIDFDLPALAPRK
jgi:hypothetical protein